MRLYLAIAFWASVADSGFSPRLSNSAFIAASLTITPNRFMGSASPLIALMRAVNASSSATLLNDARS